MEAQALSETIVSNFVFSVRENLTFSWQYCDGYTLDLNGDDINDQVFIIPWMGNELDASGYDVYFIVSDGAKGWRKTLPEILRVSGAQCTIMHCLILLLIILFNSKTITEMVTRMNHCF